MRISKAKTLWGTLALSTMIVGGALTIATAQTAEKTVSDADKTVRMVEKKAGQTNAEKTVSDAEAKAKTPKTAAQ